ncbi:MAG: low specificity L-threonine aldolase [Mucinivorans sp.]
MKSFGSDNHSGVHPTIMEALQKANIGHCIAYGDDEWVARAKNALGNWTGCFDAMMVVNGTGANVVALRSMSSSFGSVVCAQGAHINVDECGAPERLALVKLIPVTTTDGKLTPELVRPYLHDFGFEHHAQPQVISISQPTEVGTVYSIDEIRAMADLAHSHRMYLHVDGARYGNAMSHLGYTTPEQVRQATVSSGVDVMSFGGTKNGMMFGEAILYFNKELMEQAKYFRKQSAQLISKMRYVGAQFSAYLNGGLWLKMATHSNEMAALLASKIEGNVTLTQQVQTNGVWATLPADKIEALQKEYFFYIWDSAKSEVRWLCSWDTTQDDIQLFAQQICRQE